MMKKADFKSIRKTVMHTSVSGVKKTVECCSVNNKNRKLCFPFDFTHCFWYLCNRKRTVDYGI